MTGFRNLFKYGKFTNFRSLNIGVNQSFNYDNRFINKFIRQFRSSRNQIKTVPESQLPFPRVDGFPDLKPPNLKTAWKPILFSFAFSSGSLAAAAIWQYENTRTRAKAYFKSPASWLESQMNNYPKKGPWRQEINRWWNRLSEGEKIFLPILIANILVYVAWQVPRLQLTMLTYFCSNPSSKNVCWPLVLSTFSHYSLFHLLANMYVLHSFCEGAVSSLGKEQFLGLYMVAGCLSSLTSYLYKSAVGVPGLSLGASGAIMAIIGYICTAHPNTELSIIFLPFLHFKADLAIKALMALDTAGLIFRWHFFDHAAHLGGAAVGILWCSFGNHYIWQNRKYVVQVWHDLRTSFEK